MAGSSTSWFKMGKTLKGSVFISKAARAKVIMITPEELASSPEARAKLAKFTESLRTTPGKALYVSTMTKSPLPKGVAKKKDAVVAGARVPQRRPEDRKALEVRLLQKAVEEYRELEVIETKKLVEITAEEVAQKALDVVRAFIASSDSVMRVPIGVLKSLLESGFKNQHETGTSRGTLDPTLRATSESNMFGMARDDTPDKYPIYGYLSPRGVEEGRAVGMYGDVQIFFKDSVRERTTFSAGDSLGMGYRDSLMPTSLDSPSVSALGGNASRLARLVPGDTWTAHDTVGYFETQIHGKTTAADIARVKFKAKPSAALQKQLADLDIAWE